MTEGERRMLKQAQSRLDAKRSKLQAGSSKLDAASFLRAMASEAGDRAGTVSAGAAISHLEQALEEFTAALIEEMRETQALQQNAYCALLQTYVEDMKTTFRKDLTEAIVVAVRRLGGRA